jgi:tRNA-specific 2-thiouridylase
MKVLVAVSGGLKSLVTAWLLKKQGMQVRGVYLDLIGAEKSQEKIETWERKLGISIQVVSVSEEYALRLAAAREQALEEGDLLEPKLFFHRSFLFPKLLELKSQYQFDKLATGHRVLMQEDQVSNVMRVYQNADGDFSEVAYLLGRSQAELSSLLLPLGSIPKSMFSKLSLELDSGTAGTSIIWQNGFQTEDSTVYSPFDIVNASGGPIGTYKETTLPYPGMVYRSEKNPDITYRAIDISFQNHQILAIDESELKADEVHLKEVSWFTRPDLGLKALPCLMVAPLDKKAVPVRLLQYEGSQVKAFLNQTLEGAEANIFKGQTMLWVEGSEILGGGSVLGTR